MNIIAIFVLNNIGNMFIHENPHWTSFQWDGPKVELALSKSSRSIGFLSGKLSSIGLNNQLAATVESVTHDVVASSEIEGITLDTAEVRSSVARKLGVMINDAKEPTHYTDGIVEMWLDATQNYSKPLSHDRIFGWHTMLFPYGKSGIANISVGKYRTEGMEVVSGMFGRERIHYRAPEADRVESEMNSFIDWINDPSAAPSLIKSAIAHLWFVCIHPFDDGNGRIARALSDMVLSQAENSRLRYFSMSMQINQEKKDYYRVLESTQRGSSDITEWLIWYMECLNRAIETSDSMLNSVLNKSIFWRTFASVPISERQRIVLNLYLDGYNGKLTAKNWANLSKVSLDTASRDIKDLVSKGMLLADKGRLRDVAYSIRYVAEDSFSAEFSDVKLIERNGRKIISAIYKDISVEDILSDIDIVRLSQNEITIEDLLYKYFAYLSE